MKKLLVMLGASVSLSCSQPALSGSVHGNEPLFRIIENGKTGYINAVGKQVIEPKFFDAGNFSENLAPARLHGTYGYINQNGNFIIAPAFDYATGFSDGMAIVYHNGKPSYIDKTGKTPFTVNFARIFPFKNGRAEVLTATRKWGIINKQGRLIIDTAFSSIGKFQNGVAVVQGIQNKGEDEPKAGVIDLKGNFIVPYGQFSSIGEFHNGYACFQSPAEKYDDSGVTACSGVINEKGEVLFSIDRKNHAWLDGPVQNGLVKLYLYKDPENVYDAGCCNNMYQGFINLKGEVVISDSSFEYVNDFSENRAFVENSYGQLYLIDEKGKRVTRQHFENVLNNGFQNGMAFVQTEKGWGAIDVNGNFLIEPVFEHIESIGSDAFFIFSVSQPNGEMLSGLADKKGRILIKPRFQTYSGAGFRNGLLAAQTNGKLCYLNTKGEIIWQEKENRSKITPLNIDFMNRGYFQAFSFPTGHGNNYATADNFDQKLEKKNKFPQDQLSLVAQPEISRTWFKNYQGFQLLLVNNTKNNFHFDAQDSRLYLKLQALDRDGKWKDIEYLPNSWCGNSYHSVTMEAGHFWNFTVPVYQGEFKTKLRAELSYSKPDNKLSGTERQQSEPKQLALYSNEFEGSVNPGQFWRRAEYYSSGIMDPYNE